MPFTSALISSYARSAILLVLLISLVLLGLRRRAQPLKNKSKQTFSESERAADSDGAIFEPKFHIFRTPSKTSETSEISKMQTQHKSKCVHRG